MLEVFDDGLLWEYDLLENHGYTIQAQSILLSILWSLFFIYSFNLLILPILSTIYF